MIPVIARRLLAIAGLTAAIVVGWLVTAPASAFAHAVLVESVPARNDELPEPPRQIRLLFNEPVTADFNPVAVFDYRGERVDKRNGRVSHGNVRLVVADLPDLPVGMYTVTYRVTSADGHLVTDTFAFSIGTALPGTTGAESEPATVPRIPPAVGLTHGLTQAAALGLAGLAVFFGLIWRPATASSGVSAAEDAVRARRALAVLALFLAASGLAELALYAVRASGEPLSAGLLWHALTETRAGRLFVARAGLGALTAVLATVGARLDRTAERRAVTGTMFWAAAAVTGLLMLALLSRQSHAAATGRNLPLLADWLHMAAIAPWAGGLLGFVLLLPRHARLERTAAPTAGNVSVADIVGRFSRLAIVSVAVMGLTGLYAALLHVPDRQALVTTGYGRTLLLKLALLAPVLVLGLVNLLRRGRGRFRRLVAWELGLVATIVLVTGFLSSMPPAEAEAGLTAGPFAATQTVDGVNVTLEITPARYGYNEGVVTLTASDGSPLTDASVGLRLSMPGHEMGPQNPEAVEQGDGRYIVEQIVFGMGGPWDVEVAILTARGRELRTTFRLRVPTPL